MFLTVGDPTVARRIGAETMLKSQTSRCAVFALAAVAAIAPGCRCGRDRPALPDTAIAALWAVGDGEAVERDANDLPRTSAVWDGRRVQLHGARNEVLAFQLVVRAGKPGIRALSARLPELTSVTHPADSPFRYAPPAPTLRTFAGATSPFTRSAT